jgi:hypothetical protein
VSDYVRRGRAWPEQVRAGRERGAFTRGATGGYEGRPGEHDPSWRGRDEDHDFWGRDRHARRGIGERIGEFLGTRPSDASIPPPPERLERGGPQPRRVPHYSEAGLWNRVKGVFTGKGPKNYVRSDERIREDVCEQLCYHPYVDASDVEVMVTNGEVTLTGTVDDRDAKRLAEDVAVDVRGVVDVHNQLRLKPEGPRGGYAPRR